MRRHFCAHDVTNARRRSSLILPSLPDRCTPSLIAFSGQFSTQHIDFMLVQFPIEKYSCEREKFRARWAHFVGTLFPRSSVFCHPDSIFPSPGGWNEPQSSGFGRVWIETSLNAQALSWQWALKATCLNVEDVGGSLPVWWPFCVLNMVPSNCKCLHILILAV